MALEAVQAQAGHASIHSTRIYLHLADDWLASQYRKAAEVIDVHQQSRRRSRPTALPPPPAAAHVGDPVSTAACPWKPSRPCSVTRKLDMTLRYAKIANRTVADEYFAVTDKVDALYG